MSTTVDSKVVEMRFDNAQFERNVQTSMSTLDKLKQKLNFKGASDGFENISKSAKKVNLDTISDSADKVGLKFNAMYTIADQAFRNITNSAMAAGKKIVESLTIAPISDGFKEYEMTLNAVQTTMAGTGKTAKEVEVELKKLDEYADKTVYSTADMLNNLPKFTNAGVDLEVATKAMIGIANATAHAGGDASKASIAFYNLGQAIGTGYLTRMDYNSINNAAGIATMKWKEAMVEAAIAQGTLTKTGEDAYKAGKKTYSLQQLFIDGLQEQWATTDVMLKVLGDYGDETTAIGKEAYESATKIKTFSMMMDSLKASAGTGWKDTWQLIFGDLEGATELWTGIYKFIGGIIDGMNEARNNLLESALGKNFAKLSEKISTLTEPITKSVDSVKAAVDSVKDYAAVVDQIIVGDWGNGKTRFDKLTEAGYDWAHAQNLVNEKLGSSVRHATNFKEAQKEVAKETKEVTKADAKRIEELSKLTSIELKRLGYNDDQIEAFKELRKESDKLGMSVSDFILNIDDLNGRTILINSFKNAGQGLVAVFGSIGKAWREVFPPMSGDQLYNIIAGIHKLSTYLVVSDETADNLKRTFKGLFAILDIILTIVGGPIKIAFKIFGQLLGAFDLNILDVTAAIGDVIVGFRDWLDSVLDFTKVFEKLVPYIEIVKVAIKDFANVIKSWFGDIGSNVIEGFKGGFKSGVSSIITAVIDFGKRIIEAVKNVLGIHSPSKEFFEIAKNCIQGFINGVKEWAPKAWDAIKMFGIMCVDFVKGIDLGAVLAAVTAVGLVVAVKKIIDIIETLTGPIAAITDGFENITKGIRDISKGIKNHFRAEVISSMALAIAVLAGSVLILSRIEPDRLWNAIDAIAVLAGIVTALAVVSGLMVKFAGSEKSLGSMAVVVVALAGALYIMASAMKKLEFLNADNIGIIAGTMAGMILGIFAIVKAASHMDVSSAAGTIFTIGIAMGMLVLVMKSVAKMKPDAMAKGIIAVGMFAGLIAAIVACCAFAGESLDYAGKVIAKIGSTILLLTVSLMLISLLKPDKVAKGLACIAALGVFVAGLVAATRLAPKGELARVSSMLVSMAGAIALMGLTVMMMSVLSWEGIAKGLVCVAALGAFVVGLVAATRLVPTGELAKVTSTLLAMSGAIAILGAISIVMGFVEVGHLAKGLVAVGLLVGMMYLLMTAAKTIESAKGTIIALTASIAVLAGAVYALSTIDTGNLAKAIAALSTVMLAFGGMAKLASGVKSAMGTLIVLAAVILVLGGVVYALASLPNPNAALTAAGAITLLMGACAVMIVAISKCGDVTKKNAKGLILGLVGLTAIIGEMFLVVALLNTANGIQNGVQNAMLLIGFMAAAELLTLAIIGIGAIVAGTGGIGWAALAAGLVGLAAVLVELFIVIGLIAAAKAVDKSGEATEKLIKIMESLTKLVAVVGTLGISATVGSIGTAMVLKIVEECIELAEKIGGSFGDGSLKAKVDKGLKAIEEISDTLSRVIAKIGGNTEAIDNIGKLTTAIMGMSILSTFDIGDDNLIKFGEQLEELGESLGEFSSTISASSFDGPKCLAAITVAKEMVKVYGDIPKFDMGSNNLSNFGDQLESVGENLVAFDESIRNIESFSRCLKAVQVTKKMADVYNDLHFDGGKSELTKLSEAMSDVGEGLLKYSNQIKSLSVADFEKMLKATKTIKQLADTHEKLSYDGGANELEKLGWSMYDVGAGLKKYRDQIKSLSYSDLEKMLTSSKTVKKLAEIHEKLSYDGGANELEKLSWSMYDVGAGLKKMHDQIKGLEIKDFDRMVKAMQTIKLLAEAHEKLSFDYGTNELEKLAEPFKKLGGALKSFGEAIHGDKVNPDKIKKVAESFNTIIDAYKMIYDSGLGEGDVYFDKISDQLKPLGEDLKEFGNALGDVDPTSLSAGAEAVNSIVSGMSELAAAMQKAKEAGVEDDVLGDLSSYGSYLAAVGQGLQNFNYYTKDLTPNLGNIQKAATTVQTLMSTLNSVYTTTTETPTKSPEIPTINALSPETSQPKAVTTTTTVKDIINKTEEFKKLGTALGEFSKALEESGASADTTKITAYAEAAKAVVAAVVEIGSTSFEDAEGNVKSINDIDMSLMTGAGGKITELAKAINTFWTDIEPIDATKMSAVLTEVQKVVTMMGTITTDMGSGLNGVHLPTGIAGSGEDMFTETSDFVEKVKSFGGAVKALDTHLPADIDIAKFKSINEVLPTVLDMMGKIGHGFAVGLRYKMGDGSDLTTFEFKMESLGKGLTKLSDNIETVSVDKIEKASQAITSIATAQFPTAENLKNAETQITSLVTAVTSLGTLSSETITSYNTNMKNLGTDGIKKFAEAFDVTTNTTATKAITTFMGDVAAHVKTFDSTESTLYKNWKSVGENCVAGFVKGIEDNLTDAYNAGKKVGDKAKTGAEDATKVESPSKEFAKIGGFCVAGLANGINDNLDDANKAGVKLGTSLLEATQDYLGIHSPSVVFDKEVGRYIVQGIANGIKEETEAEKAAKEKADKIINAFNEAFQKEFDRYGTGKSIVEGELELWTLLNPQATDDEIYSKQLAVYTEDVARQNHLAKLAHDQWRQAEDLYKQGTMTMDEVNSYYDAYVKQQIEAANAANKVTELVNSRYDATIESIDTEQALRDAEYEFWESAHKDASDKEKNRQLELYLRDYVAGLWTKQDALIAAAHEAERIYGEGSAEAKAAWQKCAQNATQINEYGDKIKQIAIDEKTAEREKFESYQDYAMDVADKQYQIWEKTLGREATDEEKEARQLASLTTKATHQTNLLNSAMVEWLEAKAEFGEESTEAQEAHQKYLDAELNLVTTQGEILDIQESIEDRRTRLIDKQKLAKTEYEDYIKKYKKYYLENGKTLDELEKDAKLVSGYDPAKVVEANAEKATTAISTSLTGFATTAANGIGTVTSVTTNAASSFGTNFISAISSQSQSWTDAGKSMAKAFLEGLTSDTDKVKETAKTLANATLEAIQESFDSDNRPVITPVLDLSAAEEQIASLQAHYSAAQAAGIVHSMNSQSADQNGLNSIKSKPATTYNYIQNNYSPKALSRTEIYRQTKALLATKKGA